MTADFKTSKTRENLMRAFAGESQARNRYTFAASTAKKNKLHVIESIFTFTANQEKEHAEIFYNFLKDVSGETIGIDGAYPVDNYDNVSLLLKSAQHNEYEEYNDVYKSFGDTAASEGFPIIGSTFHKIAEIEKTHGDRFGRFAEFLEKNQLFVSNIETGWVCLNCGFVYRGLEAPESCPVCNHDRGYFIRAELVPYGL